MNTNSFIAQNKTNYLTNGTINLIFIDFFFKYYI